MAIFNATLVSGSGPTGVYKAFAHEKNDLKDPAAKSWGEGSAIVVLNLTEDPTGQSPSIHVKLPEGGFSGIQEDEEASDG